MARPTVNDNARVIYNYLSANTETWFRLDDVCRATGLSRYSLKNAGRAVARLAEADGLCVTVANPMDDEKYQFVLTADAANAVNSSLFLGRVEDGVHTRRQPIDDFIVLNAVPGSVAADAAVRITLERTLNAATADAVRALRENEVARVQAARAAKKAAAKKP